MARIIHLYNILKKIGYKAKSLSLKILGAANFMAAATKEDEECMYDQNQLGEYGHVI
jgi:hypothetical protein